MRKISVTCITRDEEEKIGRALQSVRGVADEIVVVDSGSRDRTVEICRELADQVYQREWPGYAAQKQFAVEQASQDWILSIDADEALSPALQKEITQWKQQAGDVSPGYRMPRMCFFMGRWIRHTTWYPDWQLRLFDRRRGSWGGGAVHESVRLDGPAGKMRHPIEHYSYSDMSEYLEQLGRFTELTAREYQRQGRRSGLRHVTVLPLWTFLENYLFRLGFLDGVPGLTVSVLSSVSVFFKYLRLRELQLLQRGKN